MGKGKILIVDDEADIREILQFNLENAGYDVDEASSAEEALKVLTPEHGLILLDVMMEGMSGFKMAEVLRKDMDNNIPIVFLTAKNAEKDLLKGFSAGGDDYISKPFSVNEVIARVNAVLRRSSMPASIDNVSGQDMLVVGQVSIDVSSKMVYAGGASVVLSKKEFEILYLLASHRGEIFSREAIIDELWKDAPYVLGRTVDVHIARIRGKLGEYKNYIVNRSGYGYSLNPVE
ncbi:MAG: response regulator transcription factor [Clostridium sp.]|nr:response regulator transcription factor [Bacteroides sp.]MCM1197473.1 response regulator transcription factor [Clostridium sp.]